MLTKAFFSHLWNLFSKNISRIKFFNVLAARDYYSRCRHIVGLLYTQPTWFNWFRLIMHAYAQAIFLHKRGVASNKIEKKVRFEYIRLSLFFSFLMLFRENDREERIHIPLLPTHLITFHNMHGIRWWNFTIHGHRWSKRVIID